MLFRSNAMAGGDTIAADDVDGIKVQRVKIGYGPDGVYADVHEGAPLPAALVTGAAVGSDRVTVPTAGTPIPLPAHPGILGLTIRAMLGNQGTVYVGGGSSADFELAPGDAISLDLADSAAVTVDAVTSGDGVNLLWVGAST